MEEDILLQIKKPGQYIGHEWNVSKKSFGQASIKFALCFPDLYEIGMSNIGIRIIYGLVNAMPEAACERVFAPDTDFEALLRSRQEPLCSLESKEPLKDFDVAGFSLGFELSYTNVLAMLSLGEVPLLSSERDCRHPLIIGGGPCVGNPEPVADFFDLFVIGEAEEVLPEILREYLKEKTSYREGRLSKKDLLTRLARIEGVYAPSLYDVAYSESGAIKQYTPLSGAVPPRVKKRFVADLNNAPYPFNWLVPYVQIVHDKLNIEVMRGCANACRFCQARSHYFPFRQKSVEKVLSLAQEMYKRTGYEEISLCGLSVSDYYGLGELVGALMGSMKEKGVSVSLPSIKPKLILKELSSLIASVKKTGLTFAPEAASERLRNILGKQFDMQEFMQVVEKAYGAGYQHVKLYFMIGLPSEEADDLDAMMRLAVEVSDLRKKTQRFPAQVNISINTLIPKPHTPFQWLAMNDLASIEAKQTHIRKQVKKRNLKVDFHNKNLSFIEGVFARGDRRLSRVILNAYTKGARFDAWLSHFNFDLWINAFKEAGIDPAGYLQAKKKDELLPWDVLDMGVSKDHLIQEAEKAGI